MSASDLINYQVQLQQVEAALALTPTNEDLLKLKQDLEEIIQLTRSLMGETAAAEDEAQDDKAYDFKSGDHCLAPWSEDGQFYEAVIEDITSDGQCNVLFNGTLPNSRRISEVCLLSMLKPSEKYRSRQRGAGGGGASSSGAGTSEDKNQRKLDPQKQRELLKKKQLKKQSRLKDLEEAREKDKMKWKQFNTKVANRNLKGANSLVKHKSIFKSPETVEGKVGVGTCGISGQPMTTFVVADKYKKSSTSSLPAHLAHLTSGEAGKSGSSAGGSISSSGSSSSNTINYYRKYN